MVYAHADVCGIALCGTVLYELCGTVRQFVVMSWYGMALGGAVWYCIIWHCIVWSAWHTEAMLCKET